MTVYSNKDGSHSPELAVNRRRLIERYNQIVGQPRTGEILFQEAFIAGRVAHDDAVSFIRLAEHMIAAAESGFVDLTS